MDGLLDGLSAGGVAAAPPPDTGHAADPVGVEEADLGVVEPSLHGGDEVDVAVLEAGAVDELLGGESVEDLLGVGEVEGDGLFDEEVAALVDGGEFHAAEFAGVGAGFDADVDGVELLLVEHFLPALVGGGSEAGGGLLGAFVDEVADGGDLGLGDLVVVVVTEVEVGDAAAADKADAHFVVSHVRLALLVVGLFSFEGGDGLVWALWFAPRPAPALWLEVGGGGHET